MIFHSLTDRLPQSAGNVQSGSVVNRGSTNLLNGNQAQFAGDNRNLGVALARVKCGFAFCRQFSGALRDVSRTLCLTDGLFVLSSFVFFCFVLVFCFVMFCFMLFCFVEIIVSFLLLRKHSSRQFLANVKTLT